MKMFAFATFLLALSGLVAGEGHNSILNFPSASNANYISFNPGLPSLDGLTVCAAGRRKLTLTTRGTGLAMLCRDQTTKSSWEKEKLVSMYCTWEGATTASLLGPLKTSGFTFVQPGTLQVEFQQ